MTWARISPTSPPGSVSSCSTRIFRNELDGAYLVQHEEIQKLVGWASVSSCSTREFRNELDGASVSSCSTRKFRNELDWVYKWVGPRLRRTPCKGAACKGSWRQLAGAGGGRWRPPLPEMLSAAIFQRGSGRFSAKLALRALGEHNPRYFTCFSRARKPR